MIMAYNRFQNRFDIGESLATSESLKQIYSAALAHPPEQVKSVGTIGAILPNRHWFVNDSLPLIRKVAFKQCSDIQRQSETTSVLTFNPLENRNDLCYIRIRCIVTVLPEHAGITPLCFRRI